MDDSDSLTVERLGYLYPTARLAGMKRILSDQKFINAHSYHVHYDGYKEVPAELRRLKWELYNLKFTLLQKNSKSNVSDRSRRNLIVSEIPGTLTSIQTSFCRCFIDLYSKYAKVSAYEVSSIDSEMTIWDRSR